MLAALRVAHGKLLTVGFDRANAPAFGASPRAADALLLLLIGAFTIVAVQALDPCWCLRCWSGRQRRRAS